MTDTLEATMADGSVWIQDSDDSSNYYDACNVCGQYLSGEAPYRNAGQIAHGRCIELDCAYLGRLAQ